MSLTKVTYSMIEGAPVNVLDFGAVGDGVTDDTAAIQAAVNALSANSCLVFPAGTYMVSNNIVSTTSDVSVLGYGAKIVQTGTFKTTLRFNSVSNIDVRGIWFVGKGTEYNAASSSWNGVAAVYFSSCTNVSVSDCYMTNHSGGSIRWGGSADGFRFTNNKIVGIGTAGGITPGGNNGDVAISGFASSADDNIIIADNDISEHCFGIGLSRGSNCVISGNVIHDIPGQHGVYLAEQSGIVIVNNTLENIELIGIKNQLADLVSLTTATDISISNNIIKDVGGSGIGVGATSGAAPLGSYAENVSITNNVITNAGDYAIICESVRNASVSNNIITQTGAYGIYWNECDGIIAENFIKYANWSALWLELTNDTTVRGNIIIDAVLNAEAAAGQARYWYYVYAVKGSLASVNPKLFFAGNVLSLVGAAPTAFAAAGKCARTGPDVWVYWDRNTNLTTKAWQFNTAGELKQIDFGFSPSVDFTSSTNLNPTTPIYGRGRRELYGTQDPATAGMTDTFREGDVCWHATPAAGGPPGWMCVVSGTPGTWKAMANLAV